MLGVRVVAVQPGDRRPFDPAEWEGALVVLARGEIELEGVSGTRRRFGAGAVLHLELPLRALHNCGDETALLITTTRGPAPTTPT